MRAINLLILNIGRCFTVIMMVLIGGTKYTQAQHLSISNSGQTGTSGTNWSITGNTLNVAASGSANIHPDVITNHLTNVGDLTVVLPWQSLVVRSLNLISSITYTGFSNRTLTFNCANNLIVGSTIGITSTNASLNLVLRTALSASSPSNGWIQLNGVNINTNGGHFWAGGGATNTTWNGLTVGNAKAPIWEDDYPGIDIVGSSITTNGGNLSVSGLSWNTTDDDGLNYGINIENSNISTQTGSITIAGEVMGRYANGVGTRIIATSSNNTISTTSGSITITGTGSDQTTNGNAYRHGVVIHSQSNLIKTSVSSLSGNISATGTANFTATINDKEGLIISGTGVEIVSQTGNIELKGSNVLESSGQYSNSIRLAPDNSTNAVRIGYNGTNAYSGNILIEGNSIYQRNQNVGSGSIAIQTTGNLTIQPSGNTFTYVRAGASGTLTFDDDWNFGTNLGSFTLGKTTNTTNLTYSSPLTTSGSINIYGGNIFAQQNLTSTVIGAAILIQATGYIDLASSRTIQTNNGNITLRANSGGTAVVLPNSTTGAITLNSGSSLLSNGGNITLGGNFDGTEGVGLYAASNRSGGSPGILINNATLTAAGGNINIYGKCTNSYDDGIRLQATITTTGSGNIGLYGDAHGGYNGTQFFGGTTFFNEASKIETVNGNLTLKGILTNVQSNNTYGINFYRQPGLAGQTNHIQILSQTGNIQITGDRTTTLAGGIGSSSWGNVYFGSPANNAYTAQGNITITYSSFVGASSNGFKVKTAGAVTYEPTGVSFADAQTFPYNTNYTVADGASSLTIGKTTNTSDISLTSAISVTNHATVYGGNIYLHDDITSTNGGNISILGSLSVNTSGSTSTSRDITTSGGSIRVEANTDGNASGFLDLDYMTFNAGNGSVIVRGETMNWTTNVESVKPYINTTGAFTFESNDATFDQEVRLVWLKIANGLTALNFGKSTNASNMYINSTGGLTVNGPMSVNGAYIEFSTALTVTNNNLSIKSSSSVVQTTPIICSGLALNGTGTFTLTNTSNNFSTLAGGATGSLLGATQIVDTTAFTIGTVGTNDGLKGSSTIKVETLAGNLTLAGSISTTSTSTDAVILTAAKSTAIGVGTAGDILVSGAPTITMGTGAIAKLFSGYDVTSTGLTALAGGSANARYNYDETSSTFAPVLSANNTYAIYRTGLAYGDLTIVSSGGDAEGSSWIYNNGVIQTTSGTANILNTVIQSKLGLANLTLEANKITFSANVTSTNANSFIVLAKTHIVNTNATTITTQGGAVLLASNVDDLTDNDNTVNGYILFASGLTITTNGGAITMGGGNTSGSDYAMGTSVYPFEGLRVDGTINLNSGGGNIIMRGKSYAVSTAWGAWGMGFWNLSTGTINSGTGTITLDGFSQSSGGSHNSGLYSHGALTVTSANTSANAIRLIGKSLGINGQAWGIEAESDLSLIATGDGGGITLSTSHQSSDNYDAVFRGETNILAKSGPIQMLGKQDGGVANGGWFISSNFYLGSKASSAVTQSSSNITIQYDTYYFSGYLPKLATSATVNWRPASNNFGQAVYTSWFTWNQNDQTLGELTIGKANNSATIYLNTALTVAGPVNIYGGYISVDANLTSSANGDVLFKGILTNNPSIAIQSGVTVNKSNGTGTLTMQGHSRVTNWGNITATGTASLNVIMWSDFDNSNNDGGVSHMGTISTNGGHVWLGGSNSSGGSYTWNGLTVGDGPSIGASGYNCNAMDLFGHITTSGGDVLLWAGNGGCGASGIVASDGWQVNVGNGDIVLITPYILGTGPSLFFRQNGGTFTMVPNGTSFPNTVDWSPILGTYGTMTGWNLPGDFNYLWIENPSTLTNFTLGRYDGMTNGGTPVVMTNSSNITIAQATSIAGSMNFYGGEIAMNANIATTNTTTGNISLNGTTLSGSGNIAIASNRIATLNFSSTSTYDGIISGTGSGLTKTGAGLLTLTKDNTYSGTTTISSGNLQIGTGGSVSQASSGTIANTSSVSVASGSKLMLSPNENLVFAAPISGDGGVEVKGASGNYYNSFLTGTAANIVTNSTVLEVLTRITGGLQSGAAVATKTAGAYIKSYHAATNTATLQFQQFDGSYTKCVFVQLTQSGSNVQIRGNTSIFNGAAYRNGNHLGADMSTGSTTAGLATSAGSAGYGISQVYMSGKVNFTGSLTYSGNTVLSNTVTSGTGTNVYSYTSKGTQEITDASSSFPPTSTVVNNGLVIFNRSTAQTIQSNLEGTEDVLQVGATITLTGTCTHSGITTIDLNKSLIIGNSSTTGSITSNVINYGSLTFNRSDSSSYPGVISGTGSLIKSGGGTHILTGLNTYSGITTINDGTLVIEQDIPTTSSVSFSGLGKLVIQPSSNSFTSAVSYPIAGFNISSGIGGLTIGKPSNTANVTFTTTTTIAGPIAAYGGTIAINGALTATNANITLGATTAVTQTQAITANGISLSGVGNFTLNNTSNNSATISAGTNDAKIGNLSYTDASGGLTIGNINNPGVYSSGTVNIETLNGDITLTEPLLTTNATASAVKLFADKNKLTGDGTGGNVTLTGNGNITVGSGGTAMVYAGKYGLCTGLQKILNTSRVRYNVDVTTSSFSPAIGAGIYGLFREGPFVWNGTSSVNHTSGTNWQGNATPPEGSYIQVSPTATNSIVLDNNWNVGYIELPAGKTIDLNGYNLTITGALIGSGIIKGSTTSSLTISGGVEFGTLYMDQTTNGGTNALQNFTIDRANQTVTIADTLVIAHNGTVTPTAGTIATGNKLKIISTINGTGRIAQLGSNADITGDVTLQRHIEGSNIIMRGWRMMSIPTTNNTFNQLSDDVLVSGPGGVSSGFDIAGSTSSIRLWQESASRGWASISNTNNTLTAGKGALIFFRGDRTQTTSLTNTSVVPNNVTSDYVGPINKGNVLVNLDFANDSTPIYGKGFNLMGNPYPSQIDWENISKTGLVDSYFWVWNPVTKGYVSNSTGIISSGQAFFVRATQTSQTVTFEENDKTATSATAYFKNSQELIVKMNLDSIQYDIAWLKFMGGASKNYVFKEDGLKLANTGYNLSFKTTNNVATQHNIVDFLSLNQSDTFILSVNSSTNSAYTLSFDKLNQIPSNKMVLLRDLNNNSLTNLRSNNSYAFTINNNLINSYGNRFLLIITDSYNPLPVSITYFEGERKLDFNQLTWNAAQEKNIAYYQVQRSLNGNDFNDIGIVKAKNSSTTQLYLFKDENAADLDVAYYRLKIFEKNGEYDYSNTIVIHANKQPEITINVYPIPTKDWINIETKKDILDLKIFDLRGVLVKEAKAINKLNINNLEPGVYLLKINTIGGLSTHKIIKQ